MGLSGPAYGAALIRLCRIVGLAGPKVLPHVQAIQRPHHTQVQGSLHRDTNKRSKHSSANGCFSGCPRWASPRGQNAVLGTGSGPLPKQIRQPFFFHEYGRRVGMVPRSSLKGGKNSLMVEKGTEKPNTKPNKQNTTTQGPQAASPPSCSLSSVQGETCETRVSV